MRGYEFLVLRRPEGMGDLWQPVTGHVEKGEDYLTAAKREVAEETGISSIARIIDPELKQEFKSDSGKMYEEQAFGFEVSSDIEEITLSKEHRSYSWLNQETALALLSWNNNKAALSAIYDKIKA